MLENYFSIIVTELYLGVKPGSVSIMSNENTITTKKNNCRIQIAIKLHVQRFLSEIGFSIIEKQLGLKRRRK